MKIDCNQFELDLFSKRIKLCLFTLSLCLLKFNLFVLNHFDLVVHLFVFSNLVDETLLDADCLV